jgi:hypothetical protein
MNKNINNIRLTTLLVIIGMIVSRMYLVVEIAVGCWGRGISGCVGIGLSVDGGGLSGNNCWLDSEDGLGTRSLNVSVESGQGRC